MQEDLLWVELWVERDVPTSSCFPLHGPHVEAHNRVGNVNQGQARPGQARTVKCYNCNGTDHIVRNCTQPKRPQNFEYFKDKMPLMQAQENNLSPNRFDMKKLKKFDIVSCYPIAL
nr:hypothetical protein [Tanacetum cinerariifolium]